MNWLTNDLEKNIPAFHLLKAPDVKHLGKSAMTQLRQMRSFMKVVERFAPEYQAWPAWLKSAITLTSATVNDMWKKVALVLFESMGKRASLTTLQLGGKLFLIRFQRREPLPRRVDGCCIIGCLIWLVIVVCIT
jgi:hypothetical protein